MGQKTGTSKTEKNVMRKAMQNALVMEYLPQIQSHCHEKEATVYFMCAVIENYDVFSS